MEVEIVISCRFLDKDLVGSVQTMFSEDAPIFADELPEKDQFIFDALESIPVAEDSSFRGRKMQANWLCGGDFLETLNQLFSAFDKVKADSLIAYYWADEDQGFVTYNNKQLVPIDNWQHRLKDADIKVNNDSFSWLNKAFKTLL